MDTRFINACEKIIDTERQREGIGTLSEKTLHAVLKNYFEPDEAKQEIKVGSFYADIINEKGIIEIQTRHFDKMRKKLDAFLNDNTVTIVCPVIRLKYLSWIDIETGAITSRRKSPKAGMPYAIFPELYKIKSFLSHPNLKLCIAMIDVEEYRNLNGWSENKKRGSSRHDQIPIGIHEEIYINSLEDYKKLIPPNLEENFTSKDYKKASKQSLSTSQTALNILNYLGVVERISKQGNLFVYKIKSSTN